MPLVRIDVPEHLAAERVAMLSDAVHDALVETADVPPLDRFHVIARLPVADLRINPDFLDIRRGPEAAIIAVTFRKGRSDEKKRSLYRAIAEKAQQKAGFRPADLMVVLTESSSIDWSFGEGIAQYAPAE